MTVLGTEHLMPSSEPALGGSVWNTFTTQTRMTAKEYVDTIAVLLQGVLASNGNQHPSVLVDQLRTTLSLHGPHSSMPIPVALNRPAKELFAQAIRISDQLVTWTDEVLTRLIEQPEPLSKPLLVRSHCDSHTLIAPAIHILLGPQGGPVPMMLFNEWIHQMVLLRDALLPFSNWMEVPLPVDGSGLRRVESPREKFLSELLIRQIRHTSIVGYARDILVPGNSSRAAGYGFAYSEGTVLPRVTGEASILTSTDLVVWSPIKASGSAASGEVETYVSREADYFAASRSGAESLEAASGDLSLATAVARIIDTSSTEKKRHAAIEITISADQKPGRDIVTTTDLGQALRGHRYAYRTADIEPVSSEADEWISHARPLDAASVLAANGMVWEDHGDYVINAGQDGLVALALLGAVYPENVVIRRSIDDASPAKVGKTGPARFVITLP